ncbi:MAG TPA: aldo/keto reductase [Acidimicrobiales bacterium]|nr:aldo/keto reductase [Acidimicrobiales bacterium]
MGSTGFEVSEVGFGAWAIGADWGRVDDEDAIAALNAAVDAGVSFIDTADVYGDGRSERLIARFRRQRPTAEVVVATKAGRRLDPHVAEAYTPEAIEGFVDRSLANLEVEALDLVQLHCPPTAVYDDDEVFDGLDDLVRRGKILHHGVSVERIDEALRAIRRPTVETVQIIFNVFRQRPASDFLAAAAGHDVGVIARVPLASGLLSGKITADTEFAADDHRSYNRHGEAFDVGETFAGVPFDVGLAAVDEIRDLVPVDGSMAQFALRWILTFAEVSTVIPGARNADQAASNAAASSLGPIDESTMTAAADVYERLVKPHVHDRW